MTREQNFTEAWERPRMAKARLVWSGTGEQTTGAILPISIVLLRQARDAWTRKFRMRLNSAIVDHDGDLWTRGFLKDDTIAENGPPGYVLMAAGEVQGIVVFDDQLKSSRTANYAQTLYIRYLAAAPWNRATGDRPPRFRGVGHALVRQSVRESIRRGTPGRVGLHSFLHAAPFFEKMSFQNLEREDARQGLVYLELWPGAAFAML